MNNLIDRLHIGIFGPRNAGKSSLLNALTGQDIAIVSPVAGTTTDPVVKNMEINGLGATALIDTAGYDDYGSVGAMRVTKAKQTLSKCDIALFVVPDTLFSDAAATDEALRWFKMIESLVPDTLPVVNRFTEKKPDKERLARLFGTRAEMTSGAFYFKGVDDSVLLRFACRRCDRRFCHRPPR